MLLPQRLNHSLILSPFVMRISGLKWPLIKTLQNILSKLCQDIRYLRLSFKIDDRVVGYSCEIMSSFVDESQDSSMRFYAWGRNLIIISSCVWYVRISLEPVFTELFEVFEIPHKNKQTPCIARSLLFWTQKALNPNHGL